MTRTHRISRPRRAGAAALSVGLALAGVVTAMPASASVVNRERYVDPYTMSFEACGTTVDVTGAATGQFREVMRGSQPLTYVAEHYVDRTTYTNRRTHRSWHSVARFTHLDLRITPLGGSLFRGSGHDAGTFSVYDSAGRLYYRDSGNRKWTETFDISTDESLSYDVINVGHFNDSNFCADLEALTTG